MNFLSWGNYVKYICEEEYPGAMFVDFAWDFGFLLFLLTSVSIFLYYFFKKIKNVKNGFGLTKALITSCLYFVILEFSTFLLRLLTPVYYVETWRSDASIVCFSSIGYIVLFVVLYILFSISAYLNIRIWYNFIDKNKRYLKWINIIFVLLVIIIFIVLFNTEGTLDILNKVVKVD